MLLIEESSTKYTNAAILWLCLLRTTHAVTVHSTCNLPPCTQALFYGEFTKNFAHAHAMDTSPLIDGWVKKHVRDRPGFSISNAVVLANCHIIIRVLVPLKPLVSLIGLFDACSARSYGDKQTYRQTHTDQVPLRMRA